MSESSSVEPVARSCGACSLCCTVLRVDELSKLAGVPCKHQREGGGCRVHRTRPRICRAYTCLWLSGGLDEDDRPDRLGAVIDILVTGAETRLSIQAARPGAFDESPRLQEIAQAHRESMPVRVVEADHVLDPDRPYRVLLAGGEAHRVTGEWRTRARPNEPPERIRLPWIARLARRVMIAFRKHRIARMRNKP